MDVNKSEVEKIAQENEIDILIHGHVHYLKILVSFFKVCFR